MQLPIPVLSPASVVSKKAVMTEFIYFLLTLFFYLYAFSPENATIIT